MKIALDADGVLFNFACSWRMCAERVLRRKVAVMPRQYDLCERFGITKAEGHKVWAVWNETKGWKRVHPDVDGLEAAIKMLNMGHEITVISSMPSSEAAKERRISLDRWGLSKADFIPVFNGNKERAIREVCPVFYADDRWAHCLEARNVLVPYITRIDGGHDGDGEAIGGVHEHPNLIAAWNDFSQQWHREEKEIGQHASIKEH